MVIKGEWFRGGGSGGDILKSGNEVVVMVATELTWLRDTVLSRAACTKVSTSSLKAWGLVHWCSLCSRNNSATDSP